MLRIIATLLFTACLLNWLFCSWIYRPRVNFRSFLQKMWVLWPGSHHRILCLQSEFSGFLFKRSFIYITQVIGKHWGGRLLFMSHVQILGSQILVSQTGLRKTMSSFGALYAHMSKECSAFRNILSALWILLSSLIKKYVLKSTNHW